MCLAWEWDQAKGRFADSLAEDRTIWPTQTGFTTVDKIVRILHGLKILTAKQKRFFTKTVVLNLSCSGIPTRFHMEATFSESKARRIVGFCSCVTTHLISTVRKCSGTCDSISQIMERTFWLILSLSGRIFSPRSNTSLRLNARKKRLQEQRVVEVR